MKMSKDNRKQQVKKALEKMPAPEYVDDYITVANLKYYLVLEKQTIGDSWPLNL